MTPALVEQLLERVGELAEAAVGRWAVLEIPDGLLAEGYVSEMGHDGETYWVMLDDDQRIPLSPLDLADLLVGEPRPAPPRARRRPVIDVQLP